MQPEAPETLRTWNRMQRRAKQNERATRPERVVLEGAGDLVLVQRAPLVPRDNYVLEAAVVRVDPDLNAETNEVLRFLLPVLLLPLCPLAVRERCATLSSCGRSGWPGSWR